MAMKHTLFAALLLTSLLVAPAAHAYLSPEDVLLDKNLYLPPTKREGDDRVAQQNRTSAERREREQEVLFGAQRSSEATLEAAPEIAAPAAQQTGSASEDLTSEEVRLLSTLRLLNRVESNQNVLLYGNRLLPMQVDSEHGGAPLAPTGAGGILSAITMVGAVGWTIWRAKRGKVIVTE